MDDRILAYRFQAVLFDFDGTLTRPGVIDFDLIRKRIGCPATTTILEFIDTLDDAQDRRKALAEVHRNEIAAAAASTPNPGAQSLVAELQGLGIAVGVITRNSRAAIDRALENFDRLTSTDFDLIISRDDPIAPKPAPDGIITAAETFGVAVDEILVVGDFVYDIEAGKQAGAWTAYLTNGAPLPKTSDPDFTIESLADLLPLVHMGIPLPAGKLSQHYLDAFLLELGPPDQSVLTCPGIGEDTAAVDISNEEVVVLTSDPITFATDAIAEYAVLVNANDIATSGARARWMLATMLFPPGTTASQVHAVMAELAAVCRRCKIALSGGHTEITDAVCRPVVTGMLAGTVTRAGLLDKKNMRSGDHVLLTKGVAVEGTAIIAREFEAELVNKGIDTDTIARSKKLLDQISVLDEAQIATQIEGVSALHDVTEGGLATALEELSIAGQHGIAVWADAIPILPETQAICDAMQIDPLGLIGSGSLLICCRPHVSDALQHRIAQAGIRVANIGCVKGDTPGIAATANQTSIVWPRFDVDEIARLFA